ncbi:MAG: hypothetical protein U9R07_03545 [Pseudomonadota bacterium]|nr:hypothetical protein [Pseudomonadota bacterium]
MQTASKVRGAGQDKDEIIKRQAIEIACLSARISEQEDHVSREVQSRTADFVTEIDVLKKDYEKLLKISNNALRSLRILCRDDAERLKFILAMEAFDEDWYRNEYPDVAQGYAKGALHHFCKFGIFEGRKPNRLMSA